MTLAQQMTTDLAAFFNTDEHAQAITYNSASIVAIVGYGILMGIETDAVKRRKTIWVKVADVPTPTYRDTVVIGSDTWKVGPEEDHEGDGYVWELPLYLDERPTL